MEAVQKLGCDQPGIKKRPSRKSEPKILRSMTMKVGMIAISVIVW
jgi:hypothetical protein